MADKTVGPDEGGGSAIAQQYLTQIYRYMSAIEQTQSSAVSNAGRMIAEQIIADRLLYVYGPGGHSNLAAQEIFFRAGGLIHTSAILDEGTLLSSGAFRSMAMERTPGYGRVVIEDQGLRQGDLILLVNAYGINAALIDSALAAREYGVKTIGVSSKEHANMTSSDHPARHPSGKNLHDVVDLHVDTLIPVGDALIDIPGVVESMGAISTFTNSFALQWIAMTAAEKLVEMGVEVPVWRSGNAPGGDEANGRFVDRFRNRVRWL